MNIRLRENFNIENKKKEKTVFGGNFSYSSSLLENTYAENNYKISQNISFKGGNDKVVNKLSEALKRFNDEIGESAKNHLDETIRRLASNKNSGVNLAGDELTFKKENIFTKINQFIVNPVIHFPVDLTISTLNFFKKIPGLKNSKFIEKNLGKGVLKKRSDYLKDFSNTMALKHYFEILGDPKTGKGDILKEAQSRLSTEIANYTPRSERTLTRIVTGIIPAFFLANDAYNLSMYVNNNKDMAKKEKKRRFSQEITRIGITAATTFATLSFLSKQGNSSVKSTAYIMAALTFVSEIIGRMISGTPFYPIGKKGAEKYAKLQKKDKLKNDKKETPDENLKQNSVNQKSSKSMDILKILGIMTAIGIGAKYLPKYIRPLKKVLGNIKAKQKEFLMDDFTVPRNEVEEMILKLKNEGSKFEKLAQHYDNLVNKIIQDGNLTIKETNLVNKKIDKLVEAELHGMILTNKEFEKLEKDIREDVIKNNRQKILQEFNLANKDIQMINICGYTNKFKYGAFKILTLPVKFVWEIINMPYKAVVEPLIDLIKAGYNRILKFSGKLGVNKVSDETKLKPKKSTELSENEKLGNSIKFFREIGKEENLNDEFNNAILNSFDNVNKSNVSGAKLGGVAKVAVSTATSAFLVLDNYNMVMIDTEGKNKKLAGQKAKERTIQRIIRIAYGACLIKLFNGVFKTQYNASLLGAQSVNALNTYITETLERTSAGLPLHEATREEIIEKDRNNLTATGLKGAFYRLMAKLTGKKALSKMEINKK